MIYLLKWHEDFTNGLVTSSFGDEYPFWWEDMRPGEVVDIIKQAYEDGYNRGLKESSGKFDIDEWYKL